ncbi:putative cytochrome P450 1B1 [Apostichopus japonicus]|uniref:Putative cytochrome P450 1B1 n=1 Tax=Stichopus japonicus TaxID=307972 RepID=A0A2G8JE89_STIJA|nr:putative cytochrome P450 1B1 [Apostichopus japonicus]
MRTAAYHLHNAGSNCAKVQYKGNLNAAFGEDKLVRTRYIMSHTLTNLVGTRPAVPTRICARAVLVSVSSSSRQSYEKSINRKYCIIFSSYIYRYEYDDPKFKELVETLDYLFYALRPGTLVHAHPWLYDTFLYKSLKSSQEYVKNYVKDEIVKHKKDLDPSNPRDFIDYYLIKAGEEESEDDPLFLVDRAWYTIKDIFSSASNPGSAAIQWLIALFCNFQEEQDKV